VDKQRNASKNQDLLVFPACTDPAGNLALEEYLLDHPPFGDPSVRVFLLYENAESLIIGKNQNPWKEVSPAALFRNDPRLYRRVTGGGAVFHGPGNLNFSFIVPLEGFSKEENLDLVLRALGRLGLSPERTPRGDLVLEGRKFSGNALCYRRDRVLHHGTLLVHADLAALRGSLSGGGPGGASAPVFETHAVASVPMPVTNLADFRPGLTVPAVEDAMVREVEASWGPLRVGGGGADGPEALVPSAALETLRLRYDSRDWTFGNTPSFTYTLAGPERAVLHVENGLVTRAEGLNGAAAGILQKPFDLDVIDSLYKKNHSIVGGPAAEEEPNGHPSDVQQARPYS
jgi:lipoate-protein ligase A